MLKKVLFSVVALLVIIIYPLCNLIAISSNKTPPSENVSEGLSVVESLGEVSVEKADKAVKAAEDKRTYVLDKPAANTIVEKQIKQIEKGKLSYRKVFSRVYIAGDSLMEGLEAYGILNSSHLFTKVSASLYHLEEVMPKLISIKPPVLILHYGLNMIGDQQYHVDSFINQYTKDLKTLKKKLPDTRIIVSLLFPVDTSVATAKRFKYVSRYNKRLIGMCKELKAEYLDSSPVFKGHNEFYGADGIHLSAAFYSKYWLKYIMKEMEIYA